MTRIFSFGKRKIVGMHYTRYIALPKAWLRNNGLERGDFIQVTLGDDGTLILRPIKKHRSERR